MKPKRKESVKKKAIKLEKQLKKLDIALSGSKNATYEWKKVMSGKEIGSMLERNGWVFTGQEGSHMNYKKNNRSVTIPNHREIAVGTLSSIKKRVLLIEQQ